MTILTWKGISDCQRMKAVTCWLHLSAWRRVLAQALCVVAYALPFMAQASEDVYLYESATTKGFFSGAGGNYDAHVSPWRHFLAARNIQFRQLNRPSDLAGLKGGVLILPSAVALDDVERRALLHFRDVGGSILATWAIGSRDAQGKWLGHDFVRALLGVTVVGEIEADSLTRFLIPFGNSPVNHSVEAGMRVWLGQLAEKPLKLKGGREAGVYLDWARVAPEAAAHSSAIVFDEGNKAGKGRGRWVVFGFPETSWRFQPDDIQAIATDALAWLRRIPDAHLAAWPNGYRAAQIIEMDTEEGFANAVRFSRLMEGINAPTTFYCLTSVALKNKDIVKDLARKHEIGFHGEVHVGFKDLPRDQQEKRLERMLADMGEIVGSSAGWPTGVGRGFRAPTEGYDTTTEGLLQAKGFRHHAADPNSSLSRLPFFSSAATPDNATGLVVLPRGQLDDLNYLRANQTSEQVTASLIAEYELNTLMGGLALVSIHSQNFADPEKQAGPLQSNVVSRALPGLIRHIGARREKVWLAPAGNIADWWRERSRASVATRNSGDHLDVRLTVSGTASIDGLTVLVHHPADKVVPKVTQVSGKSPAPEVRRLDGLTSALVFASTAPGKHEYRLSFR